MEIRIPDIRNMSRLLKPFCLLWVFCVVMHFSSIADYLWTPRCYAAYKACTGLRFSETANLLSAERKVNPANKVPLFIESQADFLKAFISENRVAIESLKKENEERYALVKADNSPSPYRLFFLAEFHLQSAVARLKLEEYLGAAVDLRKAFRLLEENQKNYPDFKPQLRGLGLLHAAAGAVPRSYQWALNILGINGTIQQGLGELRDLLRATQEVRQYEQFIEDALVLLTFLELNLEKDKREYDMQIRERWKNKSDISERPLSLFARCAFYISRAENDVVLDLLSSRSKDTAIYPVHYFAYLEGIARLQKLDLSAEQYFMQYIRVHTGPSFVRSAWQRVAWIHLLEGDTTGYFSSLKSCLDKNLPNTITDEDKAAVKEAESGQIPNVSLLKARLLFDGGYYKQAMAELGSRPASSYTRLRDQLELTYRLARIFDRQGKKDKAVYYYESTIRNGRTQKYYFAANAALLLGQIYEREGNREKSIEYYQLTLSMTDHEYQNSIDQKAKAGLNRLGVKT